MKRVKSKRALALLLAVMLTVSATGCGKKEVIQEESVDKTTKKEQVVEPSLEPSGETTASQGETSQVNMIPNGDFSEGVGKWNVYTEGGSCALNVNAQGQLEVTVTSIGTKEHSAQIYLDGFGLDTGVEYQLDFDIASSVERKLQWRIQINGGDYHPYASNYVTVGTTMQHVTQTFVMEEGSDPAPRFCFNIGKMDDTPDTIGTHTITLDNMALSVKDDSNKVEAGPELEKPDININQIGYRPEDKKTAVFRGDPMDAEFDVVNVDTGKTVFTGKVTGTIKNPAAGESNGFGDFTSVTAPGTYKIVGKSGTESYKFVIGDQVYQEVFHDSIKMLYLQRCGVEMDKTYAGDFSHPACHTTEAVIYGTSQKKDVSGGWHDAGDYGRYTVSGAKAVADLMLSYEAYGPAFDDNAGIPESGNQIPDVLDEARYELEWLLKMQDEKTGGVYHKVTCRNFPEMVMPEAETQELVIAPVSCCATGDFAAVMAMASRIYKPFDSAFSAKCLAASKKALAYVEATDNGAGFKNPADIVTGEYPDGSSVDEQFWALAELYKTTGDVSYENKIKNFKMLSVPGGLGWEKVGFYGMYTYMTCDKKDPGLEKEMMDKFTYALDKIQTNANSDGYGCSIGETYFWGSNMGVANNGILLLMADRLKGNTANAETAKRQLDYLLGENANSYCFVTGYGTLSPQNTHHRPSQALGKTMAGMLAGGPDSNLEDPYAKATLQGVAPAKCYADNAQSYSCNEVTVYWNSALIYLLAGLE